MRSNALNHSHENEKRQHGRAAVAHKGQRNAHNGQKAHAHSRVLKSLQNKSRRRTDTDKTTIAFSCARRNEQYPDDQYSHNDKEQHSAHKTKFFAVGGKNKIRL